MKAIILAGGEGTRLRPLSLLKPKPMLRLFDRPLLEHIVLLLKNCGFTEVCMTLHYLPRVIRDHFGDGESFGMRIEYRVEVEAAGTAGSVLACAGFIEDEDFLVISGDAACAYDLRAMMEKHRLSGADATILGRECADAGEFGLVLAGKDGRIRGFVEKPGPEKLVSDLINTGVYVLSPSVLREIPTGRSADFGREIFPRMLREKRRMHLWQGEGYWNDVGSCPAYRATCRDVLAGRFPLPISGEIRQREDGPCWVSPEARVSGGAIVGPWSVIGPGSTVEEGCRVSGSIVDGAYLQRGSIVTDSVLSPGVGIGREAQLRPGCVLAEGVTVGGGSLLREGVRVWPGLTLPGGSVLSGDLTKTEEAAPLRFRTGGLLRGGSDALSPEKLLRMGRSCAGKRVGAAGSGHYARLLAEAFLIGAGASGAEAFLTDASLPAAAAAAAAGYGLDICLFASQAGNEIHLRFFDGAGLPLPRKQQRQLEAALSGCASAPPPEQSRDFSLLSGTEEAYLSRALEGCPGPVRLRLACTPSLLREGLRRAGAEICPPEEGIPELRCSEDGFTLEAVDERGRRWPWGMLLCALTAAELRAEAQAVVLPYDAPALAETVAEAHNATVYRLERDGEEARRRLRSSPWCRDGLQLGLRLFSLLAEKGETPNLAALMDSLPEYHTREQVLRLDGPETAVLRRLSADEGAETVAGVRLRRGECTATVRALGAGELRILAESRKMEAAAEFCDSLRRRIRQLDKGE